MKFLDLIPKAVRTVQEEAPPPAADPHSNPPGPSAAAEEVSRFFEIIDDEEDATGPPASSLAAGFKVVRPPITQDCLPTSLEVQKGGGSKNRFCVICLKSNLSIRALDVHTSSIHNIVIGEPLTT